MKEYPSQEELWDDDSGVAEAMAEYGRIEARIQVIRGQQVILDRDLASLYGVETKRINEAVKRNKERFPEDFMFQLTQEEAIKYVVFPIEELSPNLKSQIATSSLPSESISYDEIANLKSQFATSSWGGSRKLPFAFTENGIAMLSSVLRSPTAVEVNINIMRAFNYMRRFMVSNEEMFRRLEAVEFNQLEMQQQITRVDKAMRILTERSATPTQGIFFDGQVFDAYTFVAELVKKARKRIVLIDNYVDESVLTLFDKRGEEVSATIYTQRVTKQMQLDLERHNAQYPAIEVKEFRRSHDRFLCIDSEVYHLGASVKDLGKKWFAFSLLSDTKPEELIKKITAKK